MMDKRRVIWRCYCGWANGNFFPSKEDVTRLKGENNVWSLSHDDLLRTVAHSVEAIGLRKCKNCGSTRAVVVYVDSSYWHRSAFAYDLESGIGKRVQELLKNKEKEEE
jgi:hypothetical protein